MSEFPVSNIETRILWGIACAMIGMVLAFGLPVLLMNNGFYPESTSDMSGLGAAGLIMLGIVSSGVAGLIAGLVRPGIQAIILTLICLVLIDVCLIGASASLYCTSAGIKIVVAILVFAISPKPRQAPPPSGSAPVNSN